MRKTLYSLLGILLVLSSAYALFNVEETTILIKSHLGGTGTGNITNFYNITNITTYNNNTIYNVTALYNNYTIYNVTNVTNAAKNATNPWLYENLTNYIFNISKLLSFLNTSNSILFQNITVNQTLDWGDQTPYRTLENYKCSPVTDGFQWYYDGNFGGTPFNDYLVLRKCDGNDVIPDGGFAIVMSNTTANVTVFNLTGEGNLELVGNVTLKGGKYFKGRFNWTDNSKYLSFTGSMLSYSETELNNTISNRLSSTIYYPSSVQTVYGTNTTSNLTLLWYNDGHTYNISESALANPLDFRMNFTGVSSINKIFMREQYTGNAGHNIIVYLWDYTASTWESYFVITDQAAQVLTEIPVLDSANHVSGGKVQLRFLHTGMGIATHRLYIDFAQVVQGITAVVNIEHDSMSGRDTLCTNHPWVCENFYNKTSVLGNFSNYWNKTQVNNKITGNLSNYFTKLAYETNLTSYLGSYYYPKSTILTNFSNYFTKAQYWANATAGFYTKAQDNTNFSKYTLKTGQSGMSGLLTGTQSWYSSSGYVNATAFKATRINTSKLVVTGLSAASCDVKSYTNGSFYCGTDATGSGSNPPKTPMIYDELLYWATVRSPWMTCAVLSLGTAAVAAPADKRIGVVSFLDSTTANGGYICRTDVASLMYFTGNERAVFGVATPNLASRNNITIIAGFGDATTAAEPTDGCYFYSRNWNVQGRCKNNAGPTSTATNLTMIQNQKYIWEILDNNAATSVRFTAYNYTTCTNLTQVGNGLYTSCTQLWTNTVGANIPTVAGREFGFEFYAFQSSIDAGAIMAQWDFARLER